MWTRIGSAYRFKGLTLLSAFLESSVHPAATPPAEELLLPVSG